MLMPPGGGGAGGIGGGPVGRRRSWAGIAPPVPMHVQAVTSFAEGESYEQRYKMMVFEITKK